MTDTERSVSERFKVPTHISTKKHALELADQLFPPQPMERHWWQTTKTTPLEQFQRLRKLEERRRLMLEWLYDDGGHMRIYQRPREHHFWYRIVKNLFWNIENAHDLIDQCYRLADWEKVHNKIKASTIMNGDGEGI